MNAENKFMQHAIDVAKESAAEGDYAVGAIIEKNGVVIAVGKTLLKHSNDPTLHAEIVAIRNACSQLNTRFLNGAVLYTTHEPCPMCASAAIWARMEGIVFGAAIEDAYQYSTKEFTWRQINMKCRDVLQAGDPVLKLEEGFMAKECNELFKLSM